MPKIPATHPENNNTFLDFPSSLHVWNYNHSISMVILIKSQTDVCIMYA